MMTASSMTEIMTAPMTLAAANMKFMTRIAQGDRWSTAMNDYLHDLPFAHAMPAPANDMIEDVAEHLEEEHETAMQDAAQTAQDGIDFTAKVADEIAEEAGQTSEDQTASPGL